MPLRSILLRLLLALSLVLQGIAPAASALPMAGAAADPGNAAGASPRAIPDCHGESASATEAIADPHAAAHRGAVDAAIPANGAPVETLPGSDCCAGGHCACPCAMAAATLPVEATLHSGASIASVAAHRLTPGHRAPALAHPIRPPIARASAAS